MFYETTLFLEKTIPPGARVLDVGGGAGPFRGATYVLDFAPRPDLVNGFDAAGQPAWIPNPVPEGHWIQHDITSAAPFPFKDKEFDFVVCSHTLEDIRDPIRVAAELSRVGKAGYVETPSPELELTLGVDHHGRGCVGYFHHRWLVRESEGALEFIFKPHFLHASRRFHFPPEFARRWRAENRLTTRHLWQGQVQARERILLQFREDMEALIEGLVLDAGGRSAALQWARFRRVAWRRGVQLADRLKLRESGRKLIAKAGARLRG